MKFVSFILSENDDFADENIRSEFTFGARMYTFVRNRSVMNKLTNS
jgi:hypothetical protein